MAVMVGILLVPLIGFGALAIDVGALVQERRELQNGADSATLAVAKDCAGGACGAFATTAETYADANADDLDSSVVDVCGAAPGLTACASPPAVPVGANGHVQVTTSTLEASSGANEITYRLAQVLTGTTGATVTAKAVAAWGSPGSATTAPLTFSKCEYDAASAAGGLQTGPPFTGSAQVTYFHGSVGAGTCPAGPSGADLPGGFGWLQTGAGCTVDISAGGWVNDDPGSSAPAGCDPSAWQNTILLLPIYGDTNGLSGSNGQYQVLGFAALYVTGYKLGGGPADTWPAGFSCPAEPGGSGRCLAGYFTEFVTSGGGFGGPDLGSVVVRMVG
jgi:Flp pilus assembly protein TadG